MHARGPSFRAAQQRCPQHPMRALDPGCEVPARCASPSPGSRQEGAPGEEKVDAASAASGVLADDEDEDADAPPTPGPALGSLPYPEGSLPYPEGSLPYPEGGLRAWLVVGGSFSGMMAAFGVMNSMGVFQAYLVTHQLAGYSEGAVGWIFGVNVFLAFLSGVQIGPIFDAHGPRCLVAAGSVLLVAGMMLFAVSTRYWHFIFTFSILGGIGTSLIFTPAISAIGHYFLHSRGTATGLAATGGSIGGILFPLLLQRLFPLVGFAWATRIMAFIILFLLVIANLLIRSRLPPKPGGSVWPDFRIFKDEIFALTTAGVFFIEWGLFLPIGYMSTYAVHYGVSAALSCQLLAVINVGSFFGRWLPGYVADRVGRFNTMVLTVAMCLALTLGLWLPAAELLRGPTGANVAVLCVFGVAFGFASGSNICLTPVCVGQLCETESYGRYYATCYTVVSVGCLTGIPIAGQILALDGGEYWGLVVFTAMCYAAGLVCFIAARVLKVGWKVKAKY